VTSQDLAPSLIATGSIALRQSTHQVLMFDANKRLVRKNPFYGTGFKNILTFMQGESIKHSGALPQKPVFKCRASQDFFYFLNFFVRALR
jgi:hypothetical protein